MPAAAVGAVTDEHVPQRTVHDVPDVAAQITTGVVSGAVLSVVGALLVTKLGLWRRLGLIGRAERPRTLLWFLPFVIYGVLPLTQGVEFTAGQAALGVAFGLLTAFWKLTVLGLLLYSWLPRGAGSAAILAATFWAAMHLGGILTGGIVAPTLVLGLSYLFLAFAFIAVRLRTGLLWPVVASYALLLATVVATQDTESSNLVASVADILPALLISMLLAVYGVVAWPRSKRPPSVARWHEGYLRPGQSLAVAVVCFIWKEVGNLSLKT